jgi:ketosteroid isomerase-like protein
MGHTESVKRYYEAIDASDGDALRAVLDPGFRHDRPDRTLDGRERFVEFMLHERPQTDTTHTVDTLFVPEDGDASVAAHGRLFDSDGEEMFAFIDLFTLENGSIVGLQTFTK